MNHKILLLTISIVMLFLCVSCSSAKDREIEQLAYELEQIKSQIEETSDQAVNESIPKTVESVSSELRKNTDETVSSDITKDTNSSSSNNNDIDYIPSSFTNGDTITFYELDEDNLSDALFYENNNKIYFFEQDYALTQKATVIYAWPYIDGISCVLLDNDNVIAIDEANCLLWHGAYMWTCTLRAQNIATASSEVFYDDLNRTMSPEIDSALELYGFNTSFIENDYMDNIYLCSKDDGNYLANAISNVYAIVDSNLATLDKMYNMQKNFNEMQSNRMSRIFN